MTEANNVVLRPRFTFEVRHNHEDVLQLFQKAKTKQSDFIISQVGDHVFIKFPKHKQHFWSPQLHLEINAINENTSEIHGLFGPNPTVWTFFMFLHFIVAGLFIGFGIWAYSNWRLNTSYTMQLWVVAFMLVLWFVLYFAGSIGKVSSKDDMLALKAFMDSILTR
ncbi:MAG: GTP-binding protein [Flavobacteriaceae bacterium]